MRIFPDEAWSFMKVLTESARSFKKGLVSTDRNNPGGRRRGGEGEEKRT
jgi:hypothetical protein